MHDSDPATLEHVEVPPGFRFWIRPRIFPPYIRKRPRSYVPLPLSDSVNPIGDALLDRVTVHLLPWWIQDYPGRRRGMVDVLGGRVTWHAVRSWKRRGGRVPIWAAEVLASALEARAAIAAGLAAELREHAAALKREPARLRGLCQVDPATGLDRRGGRGHD